MTRPEKLSRLMVSRNAGTGIRVRNSRSKRPGLSFSKKQVLLITLMLFFFMGTGISYVWSTFEKTQIGYDLSELKKEEMRLREINRKLRLELALLKSPQNLEYRAVFELGLRQPAPEQIVLLP
ncbi:MAG: cell division protein FtsL [Deltaproteobacteria bacterium]|nr:cell division protein FtsL [Deltaproteobacteria bacterium]MBW2047151.1 cell division protein FtsL [Deltaproteobacteria bacterium]MBW2109828.1 cell division protein FtsL [Deltaproteobacteria bacterium]MBW2352538.1 cell division protein FtsL [Deltaproteobacteria bacterium]